MAEFLGLQVLNLELQFTLFPLASFTDKWGLVLAY